MSDERRDRIAALLHQQWCRAMQHLVGFIRRNEQGEFVLAPQEYARLSRLMHMSYVDLEEDEKEPVRQASVPLLDVSTLPLDDGGMREQLAALEHFQWSMWAADIMRTESITKTRMARWNRLIVTPYEDLTEEEKDQDREWADRVLALLAQHSQR